MPKKQNNKNCKGNVQNNKGRRYQSTKTRGRYVKDNKVDKDPTENSNKRMEDIHSNDINWWNRSINYAGAVSVQQNRLEGYIYNRDEDFGPTGEYADPSVVQIRYIPTIGLSTDYDSPINRGFTSLFAEIVAHTNSGNLGFTQASLGMLAASCLSVVANIAYAKRAYGIKNLYFNGNANYPRVLYEAMGFNDYSTVDWEAVRERLNTLIDDFNSLMIPRYISLFDRVFQLPYNIYADEDSILAKLYVFVPYAYYEYVDVENKAECKILSHSDMPGLLTIIEQQLRALRSTSDLGLIMGAYRRAFPDSETIKLEHLEINSSVVPYFDRNMMWQINNMSVVSTDLYPVSSYTITEDVVKDIIVCNPQPQLFLGDSIGTKFSNCGLTVTSQGDVYYPINYRLNSFDGVMDGEWVMESTRLCVGIKVLDDGETPQIVTMGTEVPVSLRVFNLGILEDGIANLASAIQTVIPGSNSITTYRDDLERMTKFRNHPPVYIYDGGTGRLNDLRDYYVTTAISVDQLYQINRAALQSAFLVNVPTRW